MRLDEDDGIRPRPRFQTISLSWVKFTFGMCFVLLVAGFYVLYTDILRLKSKLSLADQEFASSGQMLIGSIEKLNTQIKAVDEKFGKHRRIS